MTTLELKQIKSENALLEKDNKLRTIQLNEQKAIQTNYLLTTLLLTIIFIGVLLFLYKQIKYRNMFKAMALKDELTGASNRRAILAIANQLFENHLANADNIIIAILDIDDFKLVNDNFGHDIGDQVLKHFSNICSASLRAHDSYGRYGGEEWLFVMRNAQEADVNIIFNRLRAKLQTIELEKLLAGSSLTFSLGATQVKDSDPTLNQVIKRADDNLYQAKNSGKDQYKIC